MGLPMGEKAHKGKLPLGANWEGAALGGPKGAHQGWRTTLGTQLHEGIVPHGLATKV